MARKLTYEEVKNFIEVESGSGCKLLSKEYVNNSTKMMFQCICGNYFETTFGAFKNANKRQCNECGLDKQIQRRRKTNEEFIKEVYDLVGDEYEFLEDYINSQTKIKCRHNECRHEYHVKPANFLSGRRCPECFGIKKLTYQDINKVIHDKLGVGWSIIEYGRGEHGVFVTLKDGQGYLYDNVLLSNIKADRIPDKINTLNIFTISNIKTWCELNNEPFILVSETYKGKDEKMQWKCKQCKHIFERSWNEIHSHGFGCNKCSDGLSYSEKFMRELLNQLNQYYIPEYTPKWSDQKRYDVYLPDRNIIIEVNGIQHYGAGFEYLGGRSLKEEVENDKNKERLAIKNGISNYITIDCRESSLSYIKNSVLNSKFSNIFDLSNVNWLKCHGLACNSIVKDICDLWNLDYNTLDISKVVKLSRATVIKYLKRGNELKLCEYDAKEQSTLSGKRLSGHNKIPVLQFSLDGEFVREFESLADAGKSVKRSSTSISNCLKGITKTSGGYIWKFKDGYNKDQIIETYDKDGTRSPKKVVQLTKDGELIKIWGSMYKASKELCVSNIYLCCQGLRQTVGGFKWVYYEEYKN